MCGAKLVDPGGFDRVGFAELLLHLVPPAELVERYSGVDAEERAAREVEAVAPGLFGTFERDRNRLFVPVECLHVRARVRGGAGEVAPRLGLERMSRAIASSACPASRCPSPLSALPRVLCA